MAFKFLSDSIDLEKADLDLLVNITYYFGLRGANKINDKRKIIQKLKDYSNSVGEILIPSIHMIREYNSIRRIRTNKMATQLSANNTYDGKPTLIKDYPRENVIVNSRNEEETEEVFSINEYVANIKFGKKVSIPKPLVDFIKGIKLVINKADSDGHIKEIITNKYFVEKVS
jgi:hypothetical protein